MYQSKFVSKFRMVDGIKIKCKPLSKTAVKRLASNLSELDKQPFSEMKAQAFRNNRLKLREMGIRVSNFDSNQELLAWCQAYQNDQLEQFESQLLKQRSGFPIFDSVFRI